MPKKSQSAKKTRWHIRTNNLVKIPPYAVAFQDAYGEHCGTKTIDGCLRCGAPQCCPKCCEEQAKIDADENEHHQRHDAEPNTRSGLAFTHARRGEA